MFKFVFVVSVVLLSSCAVPKYSYYFQSSNAGQNDNSALSNRVDSVSILTRNDLSTASLELIIYEGQKVAIDTVIVSNDTLPGNKPDTKSYSQSTKEARKQRYEDKRKAYQEAKKAYAATKNKRFDGFAYAGALFFTVAFLCLMYPGTALVFAILGLISSVLGLKSRIWGLSVGSLIAAGVILSLYMFMSIVLGGGE